MLKFKVFYLLAILFVLFFERVSFSQSNYKWIKKSVFPIDSLYEWKLDGLGNIYSFKNNIIQKHDSIGIFKFSESQKMIGKVNALLPINAMKLIVFSEEQQLICTSDNTLTNYSNCKELDELGVEYGTKIAVSSRPNKIWIYDQVNSDLLLFSLDLGKVEEKISNLKNTIGITGVDFIKEVDNKLFIYDKNKGMYQFDLYGTLLSFDEVKEAISVDLDHLNIIYFFDDKLHFYNLKLFAEREIELPIDGVSNFQKQGMNFYFKTVDKIIEYQLVLE